MNRRLLHGVVVGLAVLGAGRPAQAGSEVWQDTEGNKFRGEAAEVIGPLALFRVSRTTGRRIPLHLLTPDECVRFHQQAVAKPARAADWAEAKSAISQELLGRVLRVQDDRLVPAELKGRPEPEFFILFFASHGEGKSWEMLGTAGPLYAQAQAEFPGLVEALFFGVGHNGTDHADMAVSMKLPWLVADLSEERHMPLISEFAPANSYGMVVVNRDGVPLFSSPADSAAAVQQVMNDLLELLQLMRRDNPASWKDREYYWRAVQPVAHAAGRCEPMLIGDPLRAEALRQHGVFRFDAAIQVAADGHVSGAVVKPGGDLPAELTAPIGEALRQAVFVPAVDAGKWVAGDYTYHFEVRR